MAACFLFTVQLRELFSDCGKRDMRSADILYSGFHRAKAGVGTVFDSLDLHPVFDLNTVILQHLFCGCTYHGSVNGNDAEQNIQTLLNS